MIKYFCDCCTKEVVKPMDTFSYAVHLDMIATKSKRGLYVNNTGDVISGRHVAIHLCPSCYNKIVSKSVNEYYKLKNDIGEN